MRSKLALTVSGLLLALGAAACGSNDASAPAAVPLAGPALVYFYTDN